MEFLTQTFYGNTILEWTIAAIIAVASVLVGKTVYWITSSFIRKATKHTETDLDDFVVDTINEPIVVIVTVLGFWIAVQTLALPANVDEFLWSAIQAAMVLAVTWTLARLWVAFVAGVLKPLVAASAANGFKF